MSRLPTGTVTLLFTDIEGSTRLLEELGDRYADVLAEHRRLLREAFRSRGGVEVDTQGDAFFYAFAKANDAVAAAAEAQQALTDRLIRVRIGIHTGEPIVTEEGYVGIDVHRAARVMSAGHGGQVLLSQPTRDLLDSSVELRDLGEHRLKDLSQPQRLHQLGHADFPPLKTLDATNLPLAASPLLGRDDELRVLVSLLSDGSRLVTVTGPGGTGKTRLALQAAAELVGVFSDGVFWVPLAGLSDPDLVPSSIARAIGARDALSEHLREKELLILLDNAEHLLPAASSLGELLARSPRLRLLVTSRAPLRLSSEREYPLEPLGTSGSVALFLERARGVGRELEPSKTLEAICRRLDGLPLAIELAAARTKLLAPETLLQRLEHALPLLTGGARDAPKRQQTLRDTIEWSYELLDEEAKRLFARLAVFAGSFSLEAAEEVCGADLDGLAALVDFSLLKPIGESRFLMLETIREYALERLDESREAEAIAKAHARFMLALLEEARPHVEGGARQQEWVERVAPELDNIRRALAFLEAAGSAEGFVRAATAAWWCWWAQGNLSEPRVWLGRALARYADATPLRADALEGAAYLAMRQGELEEAEHLSRERVAIWQSVGDDIALGNAIFFLGNIAAFRDLDEAERLWRESLQLLGSHGYARYPLGSLGMTAHLRGEFAEARRSIELANQIARAVGDERMLVTQLAVIGLTYLDEGLRDRAVPPIRESLELGQSLHHVESVARNSLVAAAALLVENRPGDAAALLAASAAALRRMNSVLTPQQRERVEHLGERVRELLGTDAASQAWDRGAALEPEAAVEFALEALESYPGDS